ncbi:hypothetical protein DEJ38_18210 [Kocuria rosea]|nr:hypothetical protein DEJ38_18210 [Kocuria rosea]
MARHGVSTRARRAAVAEIGRIVSTSGVSAVIRVAAAARSAATRAVITSAGTTTAGVPQPGVAAIISIAPAAAVHRGKEPGNRNHPTVSARHRATQGRVGRCGTRTRLRRVLRGSGVRAR